MQAALHLPESTYNEQFKDGLDGGSRVWLQCSHTHQPSEQISMRYKSHHVEIKLNLSCWLLPTRCRHYWWNPVVILIPSLPQLTSPCIDHLSWTFVQCKPVLTLSVIEICIVNLYSQTCNERPPTRNQPVIGNHNHLFTIVVQLDIFKYNLDERPPLLKDRFWVALRVVSHHRFHCVLSVFHVFNYALHYWHNIKSKHQHIVCSL